MAPQPTGLKLYRCARLNSMYGGLIPVRLSTTKSATSAPIQAVTTVEYTDSTACNVSKIPSSDSSSAINTLNTSQTTRPGW